MTSPDTLTAELLRSTLTHDELTSVVIHLAEVGLPGWRLWAHEELPDDDARLAWAILVDAVNRRHPEDIDAAAFALLFNCEQVEACSECVARPVGNIWPRLWSSSVRCVMHLMQHAVDVPVQVVRVSA
jgi:hypothetical protein